MFKHFVLAIALALPLGFNLSHQSVAYAQEDAIAVEQVADGSTSTVALEAISVEAPALTDSFPQAPEGDPAKTIESLITNWKDLSPLAIGIMFVLILVQITKAGWVEQVFQFFGWQHVLEWKRFLVTFFGFVYGLLFLISTGSTWVSALVVFLVSAGGAVGLYEAAKPLLSALFPKKTSLKLN